VPNSRRDYFEDNENWRAAEASLIDWARPLVKRVYQNSNERNRDVDLITNDVDRVLEEVEQESSKGFAAEALRQQSIEKLQTQEERISKAMTPDRSPEELEALQRKKEETAARREKMAEKPRSLIDESSLSRDERKLMRLIMDVVTKVCGAELATRTAKEVDKHLKAKSRKKNGSG
jgi:disulfide oxidoreductase YuzD